MNGRHPTVSFSLPPLSRGAAALGIAAVACALLPLFWPTGALLVRAWWLDPNYSHGFVIPLVSAWLAWRYLRTHPVPVQGETAYGCTVRRTSAGDEPGMGEGIRFEAPTGHTLELVHRVEKVGNLLPKTNPPPAPMGIGRSPIR